MRLHTEFRAHSSTFWHKCLPNEEPIENPPKNQVILKKCVGTKRSPQTQIIQ